MMNLAFLASNNGSSMRAILAAIERRELSSRGVLAVSNRRSAPALEIAAQHGLPTLVIQTASDPEGADQTLARALQEAGADLVILSGYLRKLGPATLSTFDRRILNIHPALLPKHGGAGMYGRRVHEAVVAAREHVSGASVHIVDSEYDHGAVLAQVEAPVLPDDTAETLEARVMACEPRLFVETLQRIEKGELRLP
jgi:phosphoribosylglycinamide formyltransferase-1